MNIKKLVSAVSALAIAGSVFAGLAVTASAEGEYFKQDYENVESPAGWKSQSASGYFSIKDDGPSGKYLSFATNVTNQSGGRTAYLDLSSDVSTYAKYVLEFDAKVSPGTDTTSQLAIVKNSADWVQNGWIASGNYIVALEASAKNSTTWKINGSASDTVTLADSQAGTTMDGGGPDTWYHFIVAVDEGNAYLTINDGSSDLVSKSLYSTGSQLKGIQICGGRYYDDFGFDNVVVRPLTDADKPTLPSYTVKYILNDENQTEIKTVNGIGEAGTAPQFSTEPFTEGDQKYYCVSNDSEGKTIAGDNTTVVTVICRYAEKYTVTAVASTDESKVLSTTTVVEGEKGYYSYPIYITDENHMVIATSDNTDTVRGITPTKDEKVVVPYTTYTGNDMYFIEGEDFMSGAVSPGASEGKAGSASGGVGKRVSDNGEVALTIPEDGIYTVSVAAFCRTTGNNSTFAAYKNEVSEENTILSDNVKGHSQNGPKVVSKDEVALKAGETIIIAGDSGQTNIDYVLIKKTGDLPVEAKNIGAFCCSCGDTVEDCDCVEHDCQYYVTAFTADLGDLSGTINVAITSNGETRDKSFTSTTLTDATATIGIIVKGLNDAVATAVLTVQ